MNMVLFVMLNVLIGDSELGKCNNAAAMFDRFYSKLTQTVNAPIPLKQISRRKLKEKAKPWITKGI